MSELLDSICFAVTSLWPFRMVSLLFFVCGFVFWCDTPYDISLWYICNIVQLNSFYIKFESKHFFIYIINCRVLLSKIFHSWSLHCNSFMHCAHSWVTVLCWSFVTYFSIIIRLEWSVMAFMTDSTTCLDEYSMQYMPGEVMHSFTIISLII
jgi:hypothetical protein